MLKHWKGGKYYQFETFSLEGCPVWPEPLNRVVTQARDKLDLLEEFTKAPANLVVAAQKRVLVQTRTESWVRPFLDEFPDLPVYDVCPPITSLRGF